MTDAGDSRITRRASLLKAGGLVAAALGAGAWKSEALLDTSDAAAGGPAAVAAGRVSCVLTPEQTEGPFYLEGHKLRRNVTEGRPGVPLTLQLKVVDASSCAPISGATVDIWHCDAGGVYSGFADGEGERFLRGAQATNADGIARFTTIYPGHYQGRTVHIHVKVHLDRQTVLTTQLYFDDEVSDRVFAGGGYPGAAGRQRNDSDGIYEETLLLDLERSRRGYLGLKNFDVSRT